MIYTEDRPQKILAHPIASLEEIKENLYFWVGPYYRAVDCFLFKWENLIKEMPASVGHHHWWTGGWKDHTEQVIWLALKELDSQIAAGLNFTLNEWDTDLLVEYPNLIRNRMVVLGLLHDAEKLTRYERDFKKEKVSECFRNGEIIQIKGSWMYKKESSSPKFKGLHEDLATFKIAASCGFPMEDWLLNGIPFAAGGYSEFAKVMQPTFYGVILHLADFASANIFYNMGNKAQWEYLDSQPVQV